MKEHLVAKKGIRLMYIGEIMMLLSSFATLGIYVSYLYLLALLAVVGLILNLVGIIKLRHTCSEFNLAFFFTMVQLITVIAIAIFDNISMKGLAWIYVAANAINSVSDILQIFVVFFTIAGCSVLVKGRRDKRYGLKTLSVYTTALLLTAIFDLTMAIGGIFNNELYILIGGIVVLVYSTVAYFSYIILLSRTSRDL